MSETAVDPTSLYQSIVLERARHPRHAGALEPFDACGEGDNPFCGDRVTVRVRYDDTGAVAAAGFEARGCAISLAAADLMAEAAAGRSPAALRELARRYEALMRSGDADDGEMTRFLPLAGVHAYPSRIKCATLPWRALLAALGTGENAHG